MLLGIGGNTEGLTTAGPWGTEANDIVVVEVWGFDGRLLNAKTFDEEVAEAGGGVPKKVGWVGVGSLAGRWIADINDGVGLGT